jgi:hypothetical protein
MLYKYRVSLVWLAFIAALVGCSGRDDWPGATQQTPAPAQTVEAGAVEGSVAPDVEFARKIYFSYDRVDVEPEYRAALESVAALATDKRLKVRLVATCERPCGADERRASALRLEAVSAALVTFGVLANCVSRDANVIQEDTGVDEDARAEARSVRVVVGRDVVRCA